MNIITNAFAAVSHQYEAITQRSVQQTEIVSSNQQPQVEIDIPTETLSRATLDKQPDGALRLMTINRFGFSEYRIFNNEKKIDRYLFNNKNVDIWKIEDLRGAIPRTIYKYNDGDEEQTFSNKKVLYRELASYSEHGLFAISKDGKVKYIQENRGWFHRSFKKLNGKEQAERIFIEKEQSKSTWTKVYSVGMIALVGASAIYIAKEAVAQARGNCSDENSSDLIFQKNILPSTYLPSLSYPSQLLGSAITAYGLSVIHGHTNIGVPLLLSGMLVLVSKSQAQLTCPTFAGSYDTPGNALGVAVLGNYVYVADDDVGGLQIINIANPSNPIFLGNYDTSGKAYSVALSGSYAYVADWDVGGFQIINISKPSNPTFVASYDTPGIAWDIALSDNYAYVADSAVGGLQIINISNPANPTFIGSYDTPGWAHGVALSGNYAYVADDVNGLQVINIANPSNPTFVGSYNTPGNSWGVAVSGNYAYVADDVNGLQIINISDPSNPTFVGSYNTPGTAWDVALSGSYAFVAGGTIGGLQIINISNPSNPTFVDSYDTPGTARDIALSGNYAYIVLGRKANKYIHNAF